MNIKTLALTGMVLFGVSNVNCFWPFKKRELTKKEIIYLKYKSFTGHKATLCAVSAVLGASAVLAYQEYLRKKGINIRMAHE